MAVPQISEEEGSADTVVVTDEEEDDNSVQLLGEDDEPERSKQELERMCYVLGISYKTKLAEFGYKVDKERVDKALNFLRITKDENFRELKTISEELIKEWKTSNTLLKTMCTISWIMCIHDSANADEVRGQNFLSLGFLNKARKELLNLQKERSKYKKRYLSQRNKLMNMLGELHLTCAHVEFEETIPVNTEQYVSAKRKVKPIIRKVKSDTADRKELVLRIEMIKQAIDNEWPLKDIDDLIQTAKNFANNISDDAKCIPYDDGNVASQLSKLREDANTSVADRGQKKNLTSGLRSGTLYKK